MSKTINKNIFVYNFSFINFIKTLLKLTSFVKRQKFFKLPIKRLVEKLSGIPSQEISQFQLFCRGMLSILSAC